MKRRDFVYAVGLAAAGLTTRWSLPRLRRHSMSDPDVDLTLTAAPARVDILPGASTPVWRFSGTLHRGPADTLSVIPGSYLGPIIRLRKGQRVRIRFRNELPQESIVHWHGLDVPEAADGHPRLAIGGGAEYVYEFEVVNRAGTYWYHPHPHHMTGSQVYQGLAGVLIVQDDDERMLELPSGEAELVWVLQDRTFDSGNTLVYAGNGMMDQMHGLLGDRLLVSGQLPPTISAEARAYRIRLLNGSSSRIYKLAWNDGTPITVIGVDGGLLEQPLEQQYLTLAPAQRADVVLDLSSRSLGSTLRLESASFPASDADQATGQMMGAGRGRGMGQRGNGVPLTVATVRIDRKAQRTAFRLPSRLVSYGAAWAEDPAAPVRRITLDFRAGQWLIGGRQFEMTAVAPDEIVAPGSSHIWEVANIGGMMGGRPMAHPFHVHGTQFRVLGRTGAPAVSESLRQGLVDGGWRDTVLVLPGDTVRLQMRFTKYPGLYLYHCHILEHEDMGMMRNFRVTR